MITGVEIRRIDLPLREPFVIAYARWEAMPSVIVRLRTDDGLEGWGEAVPDEIVTAEHATGAAAILEHVLAPVLLGRDPFDLAAINHDLDAVLSGNESARCAIDLALHDLVGKAVGRPTWQLNGGRVRDELTYPRVLSIETPEAMAAKAEQAVADGYAHLKVKAGKGSPDDDVARIRAVAEAVAGRVPVRVDVNQGWRTPAVAIPAIRKLEGLGLAWIEQPVRQGDIPALAEVRAQVAIPIMADESCHGLASLLEIIRLRAADVVNLKLMKTGGLSQALVMAEVAEAAGLTAQVGSMVESSIGSAAGYHLATCRRAVETCELTGPLLFSRDIGDLAYHHPHVELSDAPGLGVTVDVDALDDLTQTRVEITL